MKLTETIHNDGEIAHVESEIFLAFIDAIGKPIANLKIKIDTGDNVLDLTTDHDGTLPVVNFGKEKPKGKVCAVLPSGKEEVALKFELSLGLASYTCESPYVLMPGKAFIHEGTPSPKSKGNNTAVGEVKNVRSSNGNPVQECTVQDCPNTDNLKLCPNQQYKPFILKAAQHGSLISQGVAALINTESGRVVYEFNKPVLDKKGKPILNKDGTPKTKKVKTTSKEWLPTSTNSRSTARGLTQFLTGTWKGQALLQDSYLNQEAMKLGYVVEEVKITKRPGKKKGTFVERKSKKLVIKNSDKLLAMRDDPETSIIVSVDYGVQNFKILEKNKYNLAEINGSEKAKLFYLMHHLGPGDGVDFINNKIKDNHAKRIFSDQIGSEQVEARAAQEVDESYVLAHRRWLIGFIDGHIATSNFACDPSKIDAGSSLFELITKIGGRHPEKFTI